MYNSEENNSSVPYRASRNLNTSIGNPNIDVNNTMNINIQNISTNYKDNQNDNTSDLQSKQVEVNKIENNVLENNISNSKKININTEKKSTIEDKHVVNPYIPNTKENTLSTNEETQQKVYVPSEEEKNDEKKTGTNSVKLGPEFRMALLIIVLLLMVLFLLPMFSSIGG